MQPLQDFWDFSLGICNENEFLLYTVYSTIILDLWYLVVNAPFIAIDFIRPQWAQRFKIQDKKYITWERFSSTFSQIAFNIIVVSLSTSSILFFLVPRAETVFARDVPSFLTILRDLLLCILIEEVGFYYSHRLFHQPYFYKRIHKIHHQWTAPVSITSVYCHPVEHAVSNVMPIMAGPILLGSHQTTAWIWFMISILSTTISHSGYILPMASAAQHDYHHYAFNENFGVLGILDTLHGTNKTFRKIMKEKSK